MQFSELGWGQLTPLPFLGMPLETHGVWAVGPITLPGYASGNTLGWGQLTPLPFLGMPLETH